MPGNRFLLLNGAEEFELKRRRRQRRNSRETSESEVEARGGKKKKRQQKVRDCGRRLEREASNDRENS